VTKRAPDMWISLNALLGVYGVKTSRLMSNQDYFTCADALWPGCTAGAESLADLQAKIKAMSTRERRSIAKKNIHRVPSCFLSDAPKHEKRLAAALMARDAA
jgi:hypothetical protein